MSEQNSPIARHRSASADPDILLTSEGGAYAPEPAVAGSASSQSGQPNLRVETQTPKGRKPRSGVRKMTLARTPSQRKSQRTYFGVILRRAGVKPFTSGKGYEELLAGKWKNALGSKRTLVMTCRKLDPVIGRRIIRAAQWAPTKVWYCGSRNLAVVGLKECKLGCELEPPVRTADDVYELAVRTARLLGVDPAKAAVDYLTAVFGRVSTGNVPSPASGVQPDAARSAAASTADPLAAARARGRRFALDEYENPDNLALLDARDYAGRNEKTINEQRQNGELYALLPPGKSRGFRYPKWQFDAEPERLAAVLSEFARANTNAWVIHSFMRRQREELGGKSPAGIIVDERQSIAPVVDLAVRELSGEQGAS